MNLWDYSPLHKRLRGPWHCNTIILNNGKIVVDELRSLRLIAVPTR